jgi:glycosyltransferase involved in cell wall biosynthesis
MLQLVPTAALPAGLALLDSPDIDSVLAENRVLANQLLAAADAFVMPSEREGLSLALLEAMGRGLPVVVSDGVGNPETVGDAGIVVPLGDTAALAGQLHRLAQDPAARSRFGDAARRRVASAFALERWQADMRRVFSAALELDATAPARSAGDGRA